MFSLTNAPETKGFIGERFDADAGLQYLNARYYDPKLGMFLQPDWWEVTRGGVGTNRYGYAGGDPVNAADPSGHKFWDDVKDFFRSIGNALGATRESRDRFNAQQVSIAQSNIDRLNAERRDGKINSVDYEYRMQVQKSLRDYSLSRINRSNLSLLTEFGLTYGLLGGGQVVVQSAKASGEAAIELARTAKAAAPAAERLGINLSEVTIEGGRASAKIGVAKTLNPADIAALLDYVKARGAVSATVSSGMIANDRLMTVLSRAVGRGPQSSLGGATVIGGSSEAGADFILEYILR